MECLKEEMSVLANQYFASVLGTIRVCSGLVERRYLHVMGKLAYIRYVLLRRRESSGICVTCCLIFLQSALFILVKLIPFWPMSPYGQRELDRAVEMFEHDSWG